MANLADVFTESERTNWLKAWLAIDIAKSGLEHFVENEANILHGNIYSAVLTSGAVACTGCRTANLLKCPYQGICNKRKANSLCKSMHDTASKQPRQCPANVCNKVLIEISKQHKFAIPSWKNTDAIQWASSPWQIAKAYLPPDGYTAKSSAQETDFNGIISFMTNCKHFDNKFSFPIAPGKTHPPCLFTKARNIGRSVRHSSTCMVADTDLQDMFITLTSLLTDQTCLANDVAAQEAVRKLAKLQTDVLKLTTEEIVNLLESAQDTLKKVEHITETAIDEIRISIVNFRKDLNAHNKKCKQELDEHTGKCKEQLDEHRRKTTETDYDESCKDFRRRLMAHYNDKSSNVPLSNLDESLDKRIADIFATPNIHHIEIEKDGKRVKRGKVLTYKDIFCTGDTSNRRIYLQGEPGSGKSTFSAKLVHDWSHENQVSSASPFDTTAFDDVLIIRKFKFLFFITLRNSRGQADVTQMIKKQLIDTTFSEDERADVYKLFVRIMNTELCLVVREGLDEWVPPTFSDLAEPSMAGFQNDKYTVLTTSRPWKLADERIKNSQIDILLEIKGIRNPYTFSKNIIRCLIDSTKDLEETAIEFESFVKDRELTSLSSSPMLYTLVICTWVNTIEERGHLNGSSVCALYTTLLESLCKKANSTTGYFNDSNPPPVQCFSGTSYLQPNIEHLDQLAKAACKLLFSSQRESSIVFSDITLSDYFSPDKFTVRKTFALKAGLLTNRKDKTRTGNSNSFVHKTIQELLAAYHIACNPNAVDVISRYLKSNNTSCFEISQVFIFVCGMNPSAANKLSDLMDQYEVCYHYDSVESSMYDDDISWDPCEFQLLIESGIIEAAANNQDDIQLKLSHFYIHKSNIKYLEYTWSTNTSNAQVLFVSIDYRDFLSSDEREEPTSHFEFNLSSCHNLRELLLSGSGILLKDAESSVPSEFPVWCIINSIYPAKISDTPPVLPSIELICLKGVTCSSTCLHILFSTLLKLDHKVSYMLECNITSYEEGSDICTNASITTNSDSSLVIENLINDSPGLWEALHGLNIKSLNLRLFEDNVYIFKVNQIKSELFSQFISSLKHLETLIIEMDFEIPSLLKAFHGIKIKSLSLILGYELTDLKVNDGELLSRFLSSLTHLETLSISVSVMYSNGLTMSHVLALSKCLSSLSSLTQLKTLSMNIEYEDFPGLWEALCGLNINSLSLDGYLRVNHVESLLQSLSSLTQLKTLSMRIHEYDCPGLWDAICGLNINSLCLTHLGTHSLIFDHVESLSQTLPSFRHLITLTIHLNLDSPGLLEALRGLNITSLSLNGGWEGCLIENHVESWSKTLSSLVHLKTLSMYNYSPCLLEALCGLNITSLSLRPVEVSRMNHVELPAHYRLSLKHLETLSINASSLWKAFHGLNVKSLKLNVSWFSVVHVATYRDISQALLSFTQLETLNVISSWSSDLWKSIHGLHIKNLNLDLDIYNFNREQVEWMSSSLSSLTQLETLSISVRSSRELNPVLWEALHGLNINSLSLNYIVEWRHSFVVNHVESLSQSLSSLKQLETLSVCVIETKPGLWGALRDLNIKRLSLSGDLNSNDVELLSQTLSSLTQLETLSVSVNKYIPGLWEALSGLDIKSLSFSDKWGGLRGNHVESLPQPQALPAFS